MLAVDVRDLTGSKTGTIDLDPRTFGLDPNVAVMHQVVTAQLAARRSGTQSGMQNNRSREQLPNKRKL